MAEDAAPNVILSYGDAVTIPLRRGITGCACTTPSRAAVPSSMSPRANTSASALPTCGKELCWSGRR